MWISVILQADATRAEALSEALMDHGALSVSIDDADAGTDAEKPQFGEPGMHPASLWDHSRVVALFDTDTDLAEALATASAAAGLDAVPPFTIEEVAEQNWVQLTQSQFDPIRITDRLWIVPSWHDAPDADAINLVLDPGMAFGTGSHPTTRLCLEWLDRTVQGGETKPSLLDYGCGSGILAIAAAKLGAAPVSGVDIDPQAIVAAEYNAERNAVQAHFADSAHAIEGQFDIVVANILSNPLKALAPAICGHVRAGGRLALSGILAEQADDLIACYAPYLPLAVADTRDGWVCLSGVKPD